MYLVILRFTAAGMHKSIKDNNDLSKNIPFWLLKSIAILCHIKLSDVMHKHERRKVVEKVHEKVLVFFNLSMNKMLTNN